MLRNLCSGGASDPTRQRCVQRSSAWAAPQTCRPGFSQRSLNGCDAGHVHSASSRASHVTRRGSHHRPRFSLTANVWLPTEPRPAWHHRGLGHWPHEPEQSRPDLTYRPVNAAFCRLFSWLRQNHVAPFFGRLGALAIQDGGAGLAMAAAGGT